MCIRKLRKAQESDLMTLFQWVNDKECRKNFFHSEIISLEEHTKWFQKKLADNESSIYILCEKEVPVGQIRLDITKNQADISYSIASEFRGKGYGKLILLLVEEEVKKERPEIEILAGKVKFDNIPSQRKFEQMQYEKSETADYVYFQKKIQNAEGNKE
ncbi:GNAT family N-acetyltransferase [Anaeromicropila populeti]|uniref:Protein N-acetyltransferase, RimJ/RimL family n=1 Tax=Anaeromicropila populeti TaxID=37658 RepID=A0A1I6HVR3_9FIRM|nr:GNAT family N-acetyltransferase [Anaeromicropila populeti]SFR58533.1 Protein N-acetyltransferase, RimJ/RimL family [Anaeromicropila populeti]